MAWSLVSSSKYDSVPITNTSFTVGLTSYSAGDVAIITTYRDQDLGDWSTTSAGWDLILSKRAISGRDRSVAVFYKVLGSSETDPVIDYSDATNEEISWTLHIFRPPIGQTATQANVITDWKNENRQNIQNPPFLDVTTVRDNAAIFCVQMQTHNDCTAVGAPPGYSIGETIFGATKDNRQQLTFYKLDAGPKGVQTIGAPTSTWDDTVSEYSTFSLALETDISIAISNQGDGQLDTGDTNEIVSGFGFGATQGSGKLELCSTSDYTGVKVIQNIDSWSDTSIQFDPVFTGLSEGSVWVFVTNDYTYRSDGFRVNYGTAPYPDFVKSLNPDIYHRFDNSYVDEQGVADANSQTSQGTFGFHTIPLTRNNTYSWSVADNDSRIEMNDTLYTNNAVRSKRVVGGWIQLDRVHLTPSGFYEEGGGVNNIYMVVGYGNTILANLADSAGAPNYKIQGYSDFKLSVDRPYHLMIKFYCSSSTGADDGRFHFFVDGVEVAKYAGKETIPNQIKDTTFSKHIGDWSYGKPDAWLDTGGTDIYYPGATNTLMSDWATWSDKDQTGEVSDADIRRLFVNGAIPTDIIDSDTPTNMQTSVDSLANTDYIDKPMPIKIQKPSSGNDLSLELDNITFDERCSMQLCWMGYGTLTITNKGTTEVDPTKCETPKGGTIQIVDYKDITISGMADGSTVVILDHATGDILQNTASSSGDVTYQTLLNAIDVIVIADGYKIIQKFNITTLPNTYVQVVQERDYTYNNPI